MIRNPYAKRPRPATPEISCHGPLIQRNVVVSTQQQSIPLLHHRNISNGSFEPLNSTKPPSYAVCRSQSSLDNTRQNQDEAGQRQSNAHLPLPSQPMMNGTQPMMNGSNSLDPWDTCDIDWDAASHQLDKVSLLYQAETRTTPTMTPKLSVPATTSSTTTTTATTTKSGPTRTDKKLESALSESSRNTLHQNESNVNIERPVTAVGNCNDVSKTLQSSKSTSKTTTLVECSRKSRECASRTPAPSSSLTSSNAGSLTAAVTSSSTTELLPTQTMTNLPRPPDNSNSSTGLSKLAVNAEAVAKLRPDAWTKTVTIADANANSRPSSSDSRTQESHNGLPVALQFSPEQVQPVCDEYRDKLIKNANLGAQLLNQWALFPHQRQAILRALLMRRMILALDMGLGKTLIGCVWAKAFKASFERLKIFVICPVSLVKEWTRTAQEATGLDVQEGTNDSLDLQTCSWAKVPTQVSRIAEHYVVVCDEAHHLQSMNSARTRDTLKLVSSVRCVGVLLLTGTPMKNGKPGNLFPLLRAVRHPFGANQKAYETHFCAGHQKSFGPGRVIWDANGSSNLGLLRELVASHLLHMTKEQCLNDLPPQTRIFRHVPVSSRFQLQHNQALNDLSKLYATSSSFQDNGTAVLGAVQRVRMIASLAKIDATVGLAKEILQNEPAIVIFTSFQKVASSVHQKLRDSGWNGELLTGETPGPKRQGMVDNFQSGLSPVFVCTFGAGGVGLTLTAACTVILLDRPWTPGDAHQAEDRVRRIGQTKPVTSIWMTAFDLDRQIDSLLEQKNQTSNTVLTQQVDETKDTKLSEAPKLSVFQMLKSLLGNHRHQETLL